MANISTTDARGLYTKKLVAVWKDRVKPSNFLELFFPTAPSDVTDSYEISVVAQRVTEKIATDVIRGTDGNRNKFEKSTEKILVTPYYREYFDQTNMQLYDRTFQASEVTDNQLIRLINDTADHASQLQGKIERRLELQRAQLLDTGILTMTQGAGFINFFRKATSMVDLGAGQYFANNSNVFTQLAAGGKWLRQNGKMSGNRIIAIFGETAKADFDANTVFTSRQNLFNMALDSIAAPRTNAQGGVYHGLLTAGPYTIEVWTYPEFYDNAGGVSTPYIDPKKVILFPANGIQAKTVYAACPQLLEPGQAPIRAKFLLNEFTDEKRKTREFHIESAGMPMLVGEDNIYTIKAVA